MLNCGIRLLSWFVNVGGKRVPVITEFRLQLVFIMLDFNDDKIQRIVVSRAIYFNNEVINDSTKRFSRKLVCSMAQKCWESAYSPNLGSV